MLTLQKLKDIKPGIFARGVTTYEGKKIRWVAVRGSYHHDWCIYYGSIGKSEQTIKSFGDKMINKEMIKNMLECDDEALNMYRY